MSLTNGDAVYIIIGALSWGPANMSPTVPPATDKNADPAIPPRNRKSSSTEMCGANAQGIRNIVNKVNDTK